MRFKTLPIFLAFFLMGLADAMGPLSDGVKKEYELSNVVATLLPFFVFIAFAVFSIPGGLLAARIGKKKLLLSGLGLNAVALLIPSLHTPGFPLLLGCIFILGIGTTLLQVAGNPIMRDVSPEGAYSRNLSLAQGIKGIGSTASTYLVSAVSTIVFFSALGWRSAFPLFCVLMIVAFLAVAFLKIDETKLDKPPGLGSSLKLLGNPVFFMAVIGIFLYVGAESCMSRFLKPTLFELGFTDEGAGKWGPSFFFLLLTIGRLLGGAILNIMSPRTCFRISALLGLVGAGALMTGFGWLAVPAVIAAGLGFANIWPMLFSITIEEKPECANELSGLMCMAISGGAIMPLLMGWFRDLEWNEFSYIVPALCFAYLLLISIKGGGKPADNSYAHGSDSAKAA
ncbi:MAG: MFS transporter [Acidobacteria bacterium]|nr:MFS transporter [Acidobacteriota bacterium]